jgi:hypothetical protein
MLCRRYGIRVEYCTVPYIFQSQHSDSLKDWENAVVCCGIRMNEVYLSIRSRDLLAVLDLNAEVEVFFTVSELL